MKVEWTSKQMVDSDNDSVQIVVMVEWRSKNIKQHREQFIAELEKAQIMYTDPQKLSDKIANLFYKYKDFVVPQQKVGQTASYIHILQETIDK